MAKKKDFTGGVLDSFIGSTNDTKDIKNTADTRDTKDTKEEEQIYRFSARFPEEMGKYLMEKKWITRTSITDILVELVAEDMKKHPEILKNIDELNR